MNTALYWDERYAKGGGSGYGSMGRLEEFKARVVNDYIKERGIYSVADYGCGDGRISARIEAPTYVGLDVSAHAIRIARNRCAGSKAFLCAPDPSEVVALAELALSLDVIYHLVDDADYEGYMGRLFGWNTTRAVIIYSSLPIPGRHPQPAHIRHRDFRLDVPPEWSLAKFIANPFPYDESGATARDTSWSNFYIYERNDS